MSVMPENGEGSLFFSTSSAAYRWAWDQGWHTRTGGSAVDQNGNRWYLLRYPDGLGWWRDA